MNQKIGIGVAWNLASLFVSRSSATIFTLFLARLLAPESFGLIAMMMIVLELSQHFVQSGLGQALIRSEKVSEADLSTIFYSNVSLSILAYITLYIIAPFLSDFYSQPELTNLLRVMGLVVFLYAFKLVPIAILTRGMNFRTQMIANSVGVIMSGLIAILLAWQGAGVWSLVTQSILSSVISALILWHRAKWLPRLIFSLDSLRRLLAFGLNLLVIGTIRILVDNSYIMVIGRFFTAEVTGFYFFAKKMSHLISQQLSGAVQKATFPAMATLQSDDELLRHKYRQIIQLMMFIIAPIMALLAALAEPLFTILLGDNWMEAVVYMQLLCIVATLYPLHAINVNVLNVKGRSDLVLKIGLFKNVMSLVLLFIALPHGVFWIVISQVLNSFISLIPNTYFTVRIINYGALQQIIDATKPILAASVAGVGAYILINTLECSQLTLLIIGFSVGVALYLLTSLVIGAEAIKLLIAKRRSLTRRGLIG